MPVMTAPVAEPTAPAPPDDLTIYPVMIHRFDGFTSVHSASFEAVRAALPSDELHPLPLPNGRAVVAIGLYEKRMATAGLGSSTVLMPAYAELPITVLVTRRRLTRAEGLVALAGSGFGVGPITLGGFALAFPLTNALWGEGVRASLGLPKFVADFDIVHAGKDDTDLRVSEEGRSVVELMTRRRGPVIQMSQRQQIFGSLGGRLLVADATFMALTQSSLGGSRLTLGKEHPVARALAELDLSERAISTMHYRAGSVRLDKPRPVGLAASFRSYAGLDRPLGKYLVSEFGLPPIDLSELVPPDLRRAAIPVG